MSKSRVELECMLHTTTTALVVLRDALRSGVPSRFGQDEDAPGFNPRREGFSAVRSLASGAEEWLRNEFAQARPAPSAPDGAEEGFVVVVPWSGGNATAYPIGSADPRQLRCPHAFAFRLDVDALECTGCKLLITGEQIASLKWTLEHRYSRKGQLLAEEATRLADENRTVLAENARLRRRVERLERVPVAAKGPCR